jgi:hypothetical protein
LENQHNQNSRRHKHLTTFKLKQNENKEIRKPGNKYLSYFLTIMMIFSLASCSTKALFQTSTVVPAAKGYVKVKTDKNNNYVIQMQISNLAGVERLQPVRQTYVVWMLTDQQITKNIGRLNSSNNLKASFETVSSFKPIKIFITAEDDENVQYPGEQVVLSTDTFTNNK